MHEYELFEYYPVTGYEITSAADKGKDGLTAIEDIEDDVNSKHKTALDAVEDDIKPYVGGATQTTDSQVSNMKQTVTFAGGALRMFAIAVDDYNMNSGPGFDDSGTKQNPRAVSKLNQCYTSHANDSFGLDYADYEKGGSKEDRDYGTDIASASGTLRSTLQTEFGWLGGNLDDKATEVEGMLKRGPNEKDLRAMYAAGALPSWVASVYPQYDFSGISFTKLPSDLAAMTPDQLADYLLAHPDLDPNIMLNLDILAPGVVDIMGQKLADKIQNADINWETDEDVLKQYATLLQTWQDSSLAVTASMYEKLGAKGALQFLDKLGTIAYQGTRDDAANLASTFRTGLGLADAMWDDQQRAQYGQDLGQAIEDNRRDYPPRGFESALSYLLQDGHYSTELLDPLGDKLYEMDYGGNSWCNDGSNLIHNKDLMASYFSSLGNNGEAALNFFDDPQRQEYYIKDRDYLNDTEGINSLLGALDAATTDPTNISDSGRQHDAAGLMSSIAEYLPDNDQANENFVTGDGTKHLAHMLSSYMESVSDGILNPVDGAERPGGITLDENGFASPIFEQGELKSLVKLTISNDDGIAAMRQGVSAYQNLEISRDLSDGTLSESVLRQDARLEGWFMDAVGEQKIQGAEDDDKRIQAWIDMGKDLVGVIPLPGAEQVGKLGEASISYLSGAATNAGGDLFTDTFANNEQTEWQHQTQAAESALEARQLMIASQLVDPGTYDVHPLISGQDLHAAAAGYPPDQVERWFGSTDSPALPSQDEIDAMPQTERDQYEKVLKDVLADKLPEFNNGDYQDTYKLAFQGYFDENFDD